MNELDYFTIKIRKDNKAKKEKKEIILDDYTEINAYYLKFLHNCWIKYKDKKTKQINSGGFITDIIYENVDSNKLQIPNLKTILKGVIYLRIPQSKENNIIKINIEDNLFYTKTTTENYKTIKNLIIEYDKYTTIKNNLKIEVNNFKKNISEFNKEKKEYNIKYSKFNELRNKMKDLALSGKLKIL